MEDTLLEIDRHALQAQSLGTVLYEHKGADVRVLDLREMGTWTDFFVIATATSNAHLDGLERHIKDFCHEQGIELLRRSRKPALSARMRASGEARNQDDEWRIIDLGSIVIHLMSREAREFYDLERLYAMARAESLPAWEEADRS